jgi:hypothetical protein
MIKDDVAKELSHYALYLANVSRISMALEEAKLADLDAWISIDAILCEHEVPVVRIGCKNDEETLDEVSRKLAAYGLVTKGFDEELNQLSLAAKVLGVKIEVVFTPPNTCTVERVEEDVIVPEELVPAHTEKKVKYVLKGDCGPMLRPKEQEKEAV